MKKNRAIGRCSYLLCLLIFLHPVKIEAQVNYVLNPSFEKYSKCPTGADEIRFATFWNTIDSSINDTAHTNCAPEYCNTCSVGTIVSVPSNGYFNHHPRTGNGMVQVQMFYDETIAIANKRDYLQGHLNNPLVANKSYCVSFYVSLEQASSYAIKNVSAYLDNGTIDTTQNCGLPQTTHIPQVQSHNIINDTIYWTKIEGSFVATGGERFITIGNFSDKANTDYIASLSGGNRNGVSWYLVDDVSVVESDIPAYAGGKFYKAKKDSVFIGRNEIIPDCMWYRNGVLIDTVHAGFWVKDTVNTMYVVKQSICGNVKYDTAWVNIANARVSSVGSESVYRIYPNPASKEIMIQAPNNTSTVGMVVHDMSGRVMMKRDIAFVNGAYRLPIDLNSGMYMVELVGEDGLRSVQRLSVL